LPEPQDEDKVFRFEHVIFTSSRGSQVDYVSLSDGEHQLAQILGTFCMLSMPNVLFLLDEPESHFNPQWRVEFISQLLKLPAHSGCRGDEHSEVHQECLLTTHAPFVPSDMKRSDVMIFGRHDVALKVTRPEIETYGTTFDNILDACFKVSPPIAGRSRKLIKKLEQSDDPEEIKEGILQLGYSVEKAALADRLRELQEKD
jgi:hypothetical protein